MKKIKGVFLILFLLAACTSRPTPPALPTGIAPGDPNEVATVELLPVPADADPLDPGDVVILTPGVYDVQPGDGNLARGAVFIEEYGLLTMESYPLQFMLSLSGTLPDPCHRLRAVIQPPDAENKIFIEVYSVADPNTMCIQVIEPFQLNLPLGSFPTGHYMVWVNGKLIAEFDA
jgi:hypothetical protein